MSFNLEEYNEAITQFADYLKEEFDTKYNIYDRQEQNEIYQIFLSVQDKLRGLPSKIQTKIIEFTKRYISLSKNNSFFLKDIEIKKGIVNIIITTNIIDLTHEDHTNFLEMINICDNTDISIGAEDSVSITIIFTIKGE